MEEYKMEKEWECWTLTETEIMHTASEMGFKKLTSQQIEDIARRFRKGVSWALDDHEEILKEAIEVELK
jgi:hypothetical protein